MINNRKKVAIISSGYFPVPATLGGAVEALDENIIKQNDISNRMNLVIFSCYEKKAEEIAKQYKNTKVRFIKIPKMVQICDKLVYFFFKNIVKKEKSMSYRYILQRLYYIKSVGKILKNENYDKVVVENHSSLFLTLKIYKNYKKYDGKYYYHLHNIVTNDYGCREIISNSKKILGVSNYINTELQKFLEEQESNKYTVLKNKIDREQFLVHISEKEKKNLRAKYGIKESDTIVLFTGRFNPEKGIKELLLAFKKIKDKDIKLLVVGGYYFGSGMISPFEKEMKELAELMKDRVIFTGFIPYDTIPKLYALSDIVVIPSVWDDPAPLTVIESLTSGKALITTCSGGIPEYADPDSSIILSRDHKLVDNLTHAIKIVKENPIIRNNMEALVREKTKDWTIESFYNNFCELLEI